MKRTFTFYFVFCYCCTSNYAQISTFDNDNEGWVGSGDVSNIVSKWFATGGNPGGWAQVDDLSTGGVWYWQAPKKFLGNKCPAYGQLLSFDLKTSTTVGGYDQDDVFLQGNGTTIVFNFPNNPGLDWTHYEVKIDESANWRINTITGAKATKAQILKVLSDLTIFKIRGEFARGTDDLGGLDNVIFPSTIAYDLDRNNSSKALNRDFYSDTICGTNARFRLCDKDISLNYTGVIDSIVISGVNTNDFLFTTNGFTAPTVQFVGNNSNRLVIKNKVSSDSTVLKESIMALSGIVRNAPKAPATMKVSVKLFFGECSYDAICTIFIFNNIIFDLDKNNSSGAIGSDFKSDTLCQNDIRFAIADKDISLNVRGTIDSIVVKPYDSFKNYTFSSIGFSSTTSNIKGLGSSQLLITNSAPNDSVELKKTLLSIEGILPQGINPPSLFSVLVKIYFGSCEAEAIVTITSLKGAIIGVPKDTTLCQGTAPIDMFSLLKGNNVTIGVWNPQLNNGSSFFDPQKDKPGIYEYKIKGNIGCPNDSVWVSIGVQAIPQNLFGRDTFLCVDSSRTIIPISFPFDDYTWNDGSKNAQITVFQPATYFLTASAKNCKVTDTLTLKPLNCKKCRFYAPNVFSEDSNGTNDEFRLYSDCQPNYFRLQVYNRWGDLMFETYDIEQGWDGSFRGQNQSEGIYVYWVEIETEYLGKPLKELKKGDFMLIR